MIKVLPLKGYKSLKALNAFNALLLGYKMLPEHAATTYVDFFASFKDMDELQKERIVRQAVVFVQLAEDEVLALLSFACDSNGIPFGAANAKQLDAKDIHELIVAVCMEIGRIEVDLITPDQKKT